MIHKHLIFCCLLCYLITNNTLIAQNKDSIIVAIDSTRIKTESKPIIYFINGNNYRSPNNYFTIGTGLGYKINTPQKITSPISMAFNFRVKSNYIQFGFLRSDVASVLTKRSNIYMNEFRFGLGKRKESLNTNLAFFVGANRATGHLNDSLRFMQYGMYTELQYTHKVFYDIGVGASLFGTFNKSFQMVGIRLEFYFSNAFIKEKK